jgi:serine/threonine-protein kinase RsbW
MSALMSQAFARELTESYPAVPGSISRARRELGKFASSAGLAGARADCVRLAVSEAVTNVVRHAYTRGAGTVHVEAAIEDAALWVLVSDEGHGMSVPTQSPGLGVGLSLIAMVSDRAAIVDRPGGGTEVRMAFDLGRPV